MDISKINTYVPLSNEKIYMNKNQDIPKFEMSKKDLYLQQLQLKFQEAKFSVGTGFDLNNIADLEKKGKKSTMIDPVMLQLMADDPTNAENMEAKLNKMFRNFDDMYKSVGGDPKSLIAWGTFLDDEGLFNSWGVSSPYSDTSDYFSVFDDTFMNDLLKFEEAAIEEKYNFKMDELLREQQYRDMQNVNPHIISKYGK